MAKNVFFMSYARKRIDEDSGNYLGQTMACRLGQKVLIEEVLTLLDNTLPREAEVKIT